MAHYQYGRLTWLIGITLAFLAVAGCLELLGYTSFLQATQTKAAPQRTEPPLQVLAAVHHTQNPADSLRKEAIRIMMLDFATAYVGALDQVPGQASSACTCRLSPTLMSHSHYSAAPNRGP